MFTTASTPVRTPFALGLLAAVGMGACSTKGDGLSIDDMPPKFAEAYCAKVYECCSAMELADRKGEGPDQKACKKSQQASFGGMRDQFKKSIGKRRAVYHGTDMQACVDALATTSCATLKAPGKFPGIAPCDTYIEPLVAVGGACGYGHECVASTCEGAKDGADGVCTARVGDGQSCEAASCADGFYCENKACKPGKKDTESCNANYQCASGGCNGYDNDAGVAGACGAKGGEGTTCFLTTGCSSAPGGRPAGSVVALILLVVTVLGGTRPRRG